MRGRLVTRTWEHEPTLYARNRSWEAAGLLDLLASLGAGELPSP